jgi:hypothetical protein
MGDTRSTPRRALKPVYVTEPVPMILIVPVDPQGVLETGQPLAGRLECLCPSCSSGEGRRWIRLPPLFLGRLLGPEPHRRTALAALLRRYPWLEPVRAA